MGMGMQDTSGIGDNERLPLNRSLNGSPRGMKGPACVRPRGLDPARRGLWTEGKQREEGTIAVRLVVNGAVVGE